MKQAINTRTQEEYDALMRYYKSNGIDYSVPEEEFEMIWEINKENTCISIWKDGSLVYGSISDYKRRNTPIIPYTEFAKTIEPDWKALYLEGRELLEAIMRINDLWVPEYPVSEEDIGEAQALYNMAAKIDQFLTNHKDGE